MVARSAYCDMCGGYRDGFCGPACEMLPSGDVREKPSPSDRLTREALVSAVRWMGDPDDPLGTFEDIGDWFYAETGYLRPGKSEPLECGDRSEERDAAWKEWTTRTRAQVRAACMEVLRQFETPITASGNASKGDE